MQSLAARLVRHLWAASTCNYEAASRKKLSTAQSIGKCEILVASVFDSPAEVCWPPSLPQPVPKRALAKREKPGFSGNLGRQGARGVVLEVVRARGGRLCRRRALIWRQRMTADLPSRRVSERVEPWTTPVAPINWTHPGLVSLSKSLSKTELCLPSRQFNPASRGESLHRREGGSRARLPRSS